MSRDEDSGSFIDWAWSAAKATADFLILDDLRTLSDPGERYDGKGAGHFNKATGEMVDTPHVNDPTVPGGVRKPYPWEIPDKP